MLRLPAPSVVLSGVVLMSAGAAATMLIRTTPDSTPDCCITSMKAGTAVSRSAAGMRARNTVDETKVVSTALPFTRALLVEVKLLPFRYTSSKYEFCATVEGFTADKVGAPTGITEALVWPLLVLSACNVALTTNVVEEPICAGAL